MLREIKNIKTPVEERLTQPKFAVQNIVAIAVIIAITLCIAFFGVYLSRVSDPYVQQVLAHSGDPSKGKAIFQINCAGCHQGVFTQGSVGPNLQNVAGHKSKVGLIYQVTSGKTPPMPKFQPNPQEMADLLSYLERL
ncbi:MAG: cytochrome c [Prochloraceae cyanobacterium]|nr:cytochrome c [Prochloraceae cyanobacterium]